MWMGTIVAIGSDGNPWVRCEGSKEERPRRARSIISLTPASVGRQVLIGRTAPRGTLVVVGELLDPGEANSGAAPSTVDLEIDRERIVFTAKQEVVLRCGQACIKLGADGKVVVEGADVVSSARRVNRIRGGAVKIN
jgi:hypothetical protein